MTHPIRGRELRVMRKDAKKTLKELARETGLDVSYLSRIENEDRTVTDAVLKVYSRLSSVSANEIQKSPEDLLVTEIIDRFNAPSPLTEQAINALSQDRSRFEKSASKTLTDIDRFWSYFLNKRLAKSCDVVLALSDWDDYLSKSESQKWPPILGRMLSQCASLKIFFSSSNNSVDQIEQVKWILFQELNCIQLKNRVSFDTVTNLQSRGFALDFFLVKGRSLDVRMASKTPRLKKKLSVDRDIEAAEEYLEKIEIYRDNKVHFYFGRDDLANFFEEYLATENVSGARCLSQTYLGSHTRPLEDYSEGSNWWKRYSEAGFDMRNLTKNRRRAADFLRQRMERAPIRQVCSKEVLTEWALTGMRPGFSQSQIRESHEDRINQLQYMCEMLKEQAHFEIAIINQIDGAALGWPKDPSSPHLSWLVQGSERLILENHITTADGCRKECQCIVNDRAIVSAFVTSYETFWNRLPKSTRNPQRTIQFLESLRDEIRARHP